jgi:hypothetical protein
MTAFNFSVVLIAVAQATVRFLLLKRSLPILRVPELQQPKMHPNVARSTPD